MQSESPSIPEQIEQKQGPIIAGFWKRLAAFIIDGLLLGVVGFVIALAMDQIDALQPLTLGPAGRIVGFLIALPYFMIFNSGIRQGQTIGKKLMKIRVLDGQGNYLSVGRSALRYAIFALPFFLNKMTLSTTWMEGPGLILFSLSGILVFGVGLSIIYLAIFNRKTRRSVHDFAVGSIVVNDAVKGPFHLEKLWKGHLVVPLILFAFSLTIFVLPLFSSQVSEMKKNPGFPFIKQMEKMKEVYTVQLTQNHTTIKESDSEVKQYDILKITVYLQRKIEYPDQFANTVASILLKDFPEFVNVDFINILLYSGVNMGIANYHSSTNYRYPPGEWKIRIGEKS